MKSTYFSALILLSCLSSFCFAQSPEAPPSRWGLVIEQDSFLDALGLSGNEDRNYTMGIGIIGPWQKLGKAPLILVNKLVRDNDKKYILNNGAFIIANSTFTPEYLGNNKTDSLFWMVNDRPFANINYFGGNFTISRPDAFNAFTRIGFNIGIMGTNFSKAAQSYIHRNHWFGSTRAIPTGWENQISKGGELTGLLYAQKGNLLIGKLKDPLDIRGIFQLSQSVETNIGYYVNAGYGLTARAGKLDKRNWSSDYYPLSRASITPGLDGEQKSSYQTREAGGLLRELYAIGGVKCNTWLYNAFLMGQFSDDFHHIPGKDIKHLTIDWNIGAGGVIGLGKQSHKAVNVNVLVSGRSSEFKTLPEFTRGHRWAGLQVYYNY